MITIDCDDKELLKKFEKKFTYGCGWFRKIPMKDRLYLLELKVYELLDMDYSKRQYKFQIKLYPNGKRLRKILGDKRKRMVACYIHRTRNIHLASMRNRVVAHELAHGVFDSFIGRRPPGEMGEIIAHYVMRRI